MIQKTNMDNGGLPNPLLRLHYPISTLFGRDLSIQVTLTHLKQLHSFFCRNFHLFVMFSQSEHFSKKMKGSNFLVGTQRYSAHVIIGLSSFFADLGLLLQKVILPAEINLRSRKQPAKLDIKASFTKPNFAFFG